VIVYDLDFLGPLLGPGEADPVAIIDTNAVLLSAVVTVLNRRIWR
jgi:hypothetical protein